MSDTFDELMKRFEEDVLFSEYPRSIGLFTIPEYPEFEEQGMWSTALDAILTTLRYLAPATLLTIFWGQQSFLFKLLKHIDSAFRAIVFSSDEQKQAVLQWLAEVGPVRVEHLDTVWRHGWILCGVLDGALPGACAGHPPTRLSLKHAQAIADTYLGVDPVFTRQELESSDSLSRHQEWKLATYLDRIRLAIAKLTPPVSRPTSQRTSPDNKLENIQVTLDYVARGSGLTAAQVNNKVYFKIYPTAQQSLDPGEITILIRGPKDAYGMSILPPILGKAQLIRQKLLGLESKPNFTENVLPITHGATYLRNYGKNDMNKTYFIPKTNYDIEIEIELRDDHARVGYIVHYLGKYEISITSRGQSIVGSPFKVTASINMVGVLEKESFCLEDGEEIDIVDVKSDRKVVLRIVDFVTEKMLLRENGCLEKITDEEAKYLLQTDNVDISNFKSMFEKQKNYRNDNKKDVFNKAAKKIIKMNRVCNVFNDLKNKKIMPQKQSSCILPKSQQDIPDIVNSTFIDSNLHSFVIPEKQNRVIIPESITVSLMTEKSKLYQEDNQSLNEDVIFHSPDYLEKYKILRDPFEDDELSVGTTQSSNNPFINDMYTENYTTEKKLGAFLPAEYETNSSQNEEVEDGSLKIIIHNQTKSNPQASAINPFVDINVAALERPKSPVYQIISGKTLKRAESLYIDCKREDALEEILGNEFINPFFTHHHQSNQSKEALPVTDFIIGAPVSLPPILRAASPEPHISSIILSTDSGILDSQKVDKHSPRKEHDTSSTDIKLQCESNSSGHSSFHTSSSSNDSYQNKIIPNVPIPSISPKKDTWDSAYVSIDDNNSSPDSNNNDNSLPEPLSKQLFPLSDELSNMGPAEREIWETCSELKENIHTFKTHEDTRISKRPSFTPIIEENDRSLYTDMKDSINVTDTDPVTTAFSELDEIFNDYFPHTDNGTTTPEDVTAQNLEIEYTIENNNICVDSASEELSDVKRHVEDLGGKISEVQASVTESDSASQILHVTDNTNQHIPENKNELQFGDHKYSNIVLEKKKYWDEKIRQIQAKTDEIKAQHKKRKVTSKPLKHNDSLSKKKGKQMIKNFLNSSEDYQLHSKPVNVKPTDGQLQDISAAQLTTEQQDPDIKLVEKWKTFWDNKLESEKETEMFNLRPKSSQKEEIDKAVEMLNPSLDNKDLSMVHEEQNVESSSTKQDLPEEVFIAFETSPKRFFGTSRKQILSKIDTFLGKPNIDPDSSSEVRVTGHETGLVSSRISLFHNISRTEELPWARRKCQSLHNLNQQKNTNKNITFEDAKIENSVTKSVHDVNETNISQESNLVYNTNSNMSDLNSDIVPEASHTFNEYVTDQKLEYGFDDKKPCVKMAIKEFNEYNQTDYNLKTTKLKTPISKSEMDIFSKTSNKSSEEELDKHKSYEDLPKICVKNFISLYEGASKSSLESKSPQPYKRSKTNSQKSLAIMQVDSSDSGTQTLNTLKQESLPEQLSSSTSGSDSNSTNSQRTTISRNITPDSTSDSTDSEIVSNQDQECTYLSLSDIDLEIVDKCPDSSQESSPERTIETGSMEYKNRFQTAKQFFQSLEELREQKKSRKLNECELLLYGKGNESLTDDKSIRQQGRIKKKLKSISLPSSELAKAWNELKDMEDTDSSSKMIKISEKFNVEDLFNDVMEGRLSRQGSLRGIPHKKAVLETFKSMENITDKKLSSYELAVSQLNDFAKENQIKNAQTYLSEYPYLPTTDPSKYHSRLDASASGLISFKEVLEQKPRRNSVPDLRLNPSFTVDL